MENAMKRSYVACLAAIIFVLIERSGSAHVTIRATGPLPPSSYATVSLVVPNERLVETARVVVEVPDDFLQAGGRISRVEFLPDWTVRLEKEEKPADIYTKEMDERAKRAQEAASADEQTAKGDDPKRSSSSSAPTKSGRSGSSASSSKAGRCRWTDSRNSGSVCSSLSAQARFVFRRRRCTPTAGKLAGHSW